jgi:cytochrome b
MPTDTKIKVWDPLVRSFHWILVTAFFIAYITEEDLLSVHVWAGYAVAAALSIRLIWGFIGTRHARFTDFVTSPGTAVRYAKDVISRRARRYIGHNPAGGLMIVVMMISLIFTTVSGIAVYGAGDEHAGPMASLFISTGEHWEGLLEEIHEFFANFTLFLVFIHIGGVLFESLVHRENLVSSMINGFKRAEENAMENELEND